MRFRPWEKVSIDWPPSQIVPSQVGHSLSADPSWTGDGTLARVEAHHENPVEGWKQIAAYLDLSVKIARKCARRRVDRAIRQTFLGRTFAGHRSFGTTQKYLDLAETLPAGGVRTPFAALRAPSSRRSVPRGCPLSILTMRNYGRLNGVCTVANQVISAIYPCFRMACLRFDCTWSTWRRPGRSLGGPIGASALSRRGVGEVTQGGSENERTGGGARSVGVHAKWTTIGVAAETVGRGTLLS
jgi:hypothetical protein